MKALALLATWFCIGLCTSSQYEMSLLQTELHVSHVVQGRKQKEDNGETQTALTLQEPLPICHGGSEDHTERDELACLLSDMKCGQAKNDMYCSKCGKCQAITCESACDCSGSCGCLAGSCASEGVHGHVFCRPTPCRGDHPWALSKCPGTPGDPACWANAAFETCNGSIEVWDKVCRRGKKLIETAQGWIYEDICTREANEANEDAKLVQYIWYQRMVATRKDKPYCQGVDDKKYWKLQNCPHNSSHFSCWAISGFEYCKQTGKHEDEVGGAGFYAYDYICMGEAMRKEDNLCHAGASDAELEDMHRRYISRTVLPYCGKPSYWSDPRKKLLEEPDPPKKQEPDPPKKEEPDPPKQQDNGFQQMMEAMMKPILQALGFA